MIGFAHIRYRLRFPTSHVYPSDQRTSTAVTNRVLERISLGTFEPDHFEERILCLIWKPGQDARQPIRRATFTTVPPGQVLVEHPALRNQIRNRIAIRVDLLRWDPCAEAARE